MANRKRKPKEVLKLIIAQSKKQTSWWQTSYPTKEQQKKDRDVQTPPPPADVPIETAQYDDNTPISEDDISSEVSLSEVDEDEEEEAFNTAGYEILPIDEDNVKPTGYRPPKASIVLNAYNPDTPYLKVMEYAEPDKAIETYYQLKKEYGQTPSFYVDVADYFFKKGDTQQAILVVSNLAELSLENAQLLRILGYKLSSYKAYKDAIAVFRKVMAIRKEEPQSYHDLGWALAEDKQYQEAVEILYKIVLDVRDTRLGDLQLITMNDINSLIARHKEIKTDFIDKHLLKKEPVDIRVVLSWDTDNCDMDLWVTDPTNETCFFQNRLTYLGGKISKDVTLGYGPEEFMLRKAPKGTYKIAVNYYGSHSQKQLMPVTLRITFFTHFGTDKEEKQETTVRVTNEKDVIEVGSFEFK